MAIWELRCGSVNEFASIVSLEDGGIMLEALAASKGPKEAAVFKDPLTAMVRIYVNEAGRKTMEKLAEDAGLTGIECAKPRPL